MPTSVLDLLLHDAAGPGVAAADLQHALLAGQHLGDELVPRQHDAEPLRIEMPRGVGAQAKARQTLAIAEVDVLPDIAVRVSSVRSWIRIHPQQHPAGFAATDDGDRLVDLVERELVGDEAIQRSCLPAFISPT